MADDTTKDGKGGASNSPKEVSAESVPDVGLPLAPEAPGMAADDIAAEVGLPRAAIPPVSEPPEKSPMTPVLDMSGQTSGVIQDDIARILEETKLPERKEFRATADAPLTQTPPPDVVPKAAAPQAPSPAQTIQHTAKQDSVVTPLHTLKDDLQTVVREKKISLVRAAALEEDKRAQDRSAADAETHAPQKRRIVQALIAVGALVFLGVAAIGGVAIVMQGRDAGTEEVRFSDGLLFSEQTVPLPIKNRSPIELKRLIAGARGATDLTLGAITRIAPVVEETSAEGVAQIRLASTEEFLTAIDAHPPEELVRALGDSFFFGIHTVDENAPMLIIPVLSYERAFAGMLLWERTLNTDLAPMFTPVSALIRDEGGLVVARTFGDDVMRNYDVRTLKDDAGSIQLYYSFPTRNLLVIAESEYSFTEILSRLRADRRL